LAVREARRQVAGQDQRQRGLADAAQPAGAEDAGPALEAGSQRGQVVAAADEVVRRPRDLSGAARPAAGALQPVPEGAERLVLELVGVAEPADDALSLDAPLQRLQPRQGVALHAVLRPGNAVGDEEAQALQAARLGVLVLRFGDGAGVAGLDVAV